VNITAVIGTYNRQHVLNRAIFSLINQTVPVKQIIVINDGSKDPVEQPLCKVVNLPKNVGLPFARNIGAKLTREGTTHVYWMDDDCELDPNCLKILSSSEIWKDDVAATGGSVWETPPEKRYRILTDKPMMIDSQGVVYDCGGLNVDESRWYLADHLRGGNMLFRKDVFFEVGMLDEAYADVQGRSFKDETDLCLKFKKAGYKMFFNPTAKARHYREKIGGVWEKFGSDVHFIRESEAYFHNKWRPLHYLSDWSKQVERMFEEVIKPQ